MKSQLRGKFIKGTAISVMVMALYGSALCMALYDSALCMSVYPVRISLCFSPLTYGIKCLEKSHLFEATVERISVCNVIEKLMEHGMHCLPSGCHSVKVVSKTVGYSLDAMVTDLCRQLTYVLLE